MLRAVKCIGVITFHSSELLDFPTTLGGLPCFCCMFHFMLINLVHISYFVQKTHHRHPHCSTDFPPSTLTIQPPCFFIPLFTHHPWPLLQGSLSGLSAIFFLGQKVEAKLGLDVILINGTFKTASRLFFSPTDDKRTLINHVQIKIYLNLLMYLYKRYSI